MNRIRDYEVSVWTLQDSFITVLKPSKLESKGQVQEPNMHMIDDGTLEFSFKIPMYLHREENDNWFDEENENTFVRENPLWTNVVNGVIIANLRKIKVIFNKDTSYEKVFEFLIIKVTEEHQNEEKWCSVECEGLAFQELGKVGYKLSLTEDTYNNDYNDWADAENVETRGEMPINNINYWLDKTFKDSQWDYEICMDWSMYDGITHYKRYPINEDNLFSNAALRVGERYLVRLKDVERRGKLSENSNPLDIATELIPVDLYEPPNQNETNPPPRRYHFYNGGGYSAYVIGYDENDEYVAYCTASPKNQVIGINAKWNTQFMAPGKAISDIKKIRIQFYVDSATNPSDLNVLLSKNQLVKTIGEDTSPQYLGPHHDDALTFADYGDEFENIVYTDLSQNEKEQINNLRDRMGYRRHDRIYENSYVSAWNYEQATTEIIAAEEQLAQEKYRLIKCEESNRYNITQTIAETFGVFCKYVYDHDDNYHITGRHVVFYNNFLQESTGAIDLTYPYDTSSITREMDSTDTVTKMFVKTLADETMPSGWVSIGDSRANKSGEDYLLNFDYLYTIGTLSEEQYSFIPKFEYQMGVYNKGLNERAERLLILYQKLPEIQGLKAVAENAQALDLERIGAANDLLNALTDSTGIIHRTAENPASLIIIEGTDGKYINFTEKGILTNSLKMYATFDSTSHTLSDPVDGDLGEDTFVSKVINLRGDNLKTRIYATYDYQPELYYEKVKDIWRARLHKDQADAEKYTAEEEKINTEIETLEAEYDELLEKKQKVLNYFERIMGPAIREGNWQPEDSYSKYCSHNNFDFTLTSANDDNIELVWDTELFEEEEVGWRYIGADQQELIVYPCIELTTADLREIFTESKNGTIAFAFNDIKTSETTLKYRRYFGLGSQAVLRFLKHNDEIKPVLMILDVENIYYGDAENVQSFLLRDDAKIVCVTTTEDANTGVNVNEVEIKEVNSFINEDDFNLTDPADLTYKVTYPRLKTSHMELQTNTSSIHLRANNDLLDMYEDYYILSRVEEDGQAYYITIKPESALHGDDAYDAIKYSLNYLLSNAATAIYLDASEVLRENSYPKVSYTIDVSMVKEDFIRVAYDTLNKIVHINDTDLKFKDVQGYISELELNLDKPWEDKITIKNYKTKFEDLFSSIVAQTEAMKKNSYITDIAGQAFSTSGQLLPNAAQSLLSNMTYSLNGGKLIVDQNNGIWGVSKDGVVALRSDGIFTANEVDENGDWIWNTGILPSGINANLITAGQLDTNLINIYAGDNLRFKMNGEGLFAYKQAGISKDLKDFLKVSSFGYNTVLGNQIGKGTYLFKTNYTGNEAKVTFAPAPIINTGARFANNAVLQAASEGFSDKPLNESNPIEITISNDTEQNADRITFDFSNVESVNSYKWEVYLLTETTPVDTELDKKQYVVLNEDGLFLRAEEGAKIWNDTLSKQVDRVEVSWDGLKLRNWNGEEVFYADPDTGDLTLKGTIKADAGYFNGELQSAVVYANSFLIKTSSGDTGSPIESYIESNIGSSSNLVNAFTAAATLINSALVPSTEPLSGSGLVAGMANTLNAGRNKIWESENGAYPNDFTFHKGDIWIYEEDGASSTLIAITDSSHVTLPAQLAQPTPGWNLTQDGSIKSLVGAKITVDTEAGNIDIKAVSNILLSGADLQITGQHNVNIGAGRSINLNVLRTGNEAFGSTGLSISGEGLDFKTADSNTASALKINKTDGFLMATGGTGTSGVASVSIKDTGIQLTTVGGQARQGSYVNLDQSKVELFSGATNEENGTSVVVNKDHFHINSVDANGADIANTYVDISANGIDIGSNGTFTVDMTNFKVNGIGDITKDIFYVGNNSQFMKFTQAGDLVISGKVEATSGKIGPWKIGENSIFYGEDDVDEAHSDYKFGKQGLSIGGIFNVNTDQTSENIFDSFIIKDSKDADDSTSNDLFGIVQEQNEDAINLFPSTYSNNYVITGLEKNTDYTIYLTSDENLLTEGTSIGTQKLRVYFCAGDDGVETDDAYRLYSGIELTQNSGEYGRLYLFTTPTSDDARNYVISCLPRLVKTEKKYKLTGTLLSQIDSAVVLANKISENIGQTKIKYTTTLSNNLPASGGNKLEGNPGDICVYYNEKSTHEPGTTQLVGEVVRTRTDQYPYYLPVGTNFENDGYAASRNESRFGSYGGNTSYGLVSRWNTSALSGTNFSISDQATFPANLKTRYVRVGKVQGYTGNGINVSPNRYQSGIYGLFLPWRVTSDLSTNTVIKIYYSFVRNISGAVYDQIPYNETSNYGPVYFMIGKPGSNNLNWDLEKKKDNEDHLVNFLAENVDTTSYYYRINATDGGISYNIQERCLTITLKEKIEATFKNNVDSEPYYLIFQIDRGSPKNSLFYIDSLSVAVCNSTYELPSDTSGGSNGAAIFVYSNNEWVKIGP